MAESRKKKAELKKIEEEKKAAIKKANENTCKKRLQTLSLLQRY